jgi:hypothetical protein
MGWNGAGQWSPPSLPGSWNPAIVGQQSTASDWNTFLAALSGVQGISNLICKDGQTQPTANLPMAGFRHTNVGAPSAMNQYGVVSDIINTGYVYGADVGAADAYEITLSPVPAAYAIGQVFRTIIANTNLTTTPTFKVTGLDPGTIESGTGGALTIGILQAGASALVQVSDLSGSTPTFQLFAFAYTPIPVQVVRSYLAGFDTANNVSTPNTKIDVGAGECADATNTVMMSYAGGTLDCSTTGVNGLDTGTLANSTWYYDFVIGKPDGTTALLASTSLASPTLPSGYTLKRRIGAFRTDGSAHILAYLQYGDRFLWKSPPTDQNAVSVAVTAANYALSVPPGLSVNALVRIFATGAASYAIYSPNQTAETVGNQLPPANLIATSAVSGNAAAGNYEIVTDTSAQIAAVCDRTGGVITMVTDGWIDRL